ncbi:MAG: bifunctional diaminohydroxyphosphoribosylaminopyrimidine deaminase/5-amino-6-(5-phosphoribosylamino)uracil reductase RibD [Bacteroidales bacterium]|nr:bifunctional diaminohydroxyphosphoribosylaminopyrimidine deaminase/5-amino-6-(5-phosphoribosylamino)uracil reductase RibD [Bacteroidales bacterium]
MKRCLDLAALGLGHTASNPLVGSVIVHNDRIIGEGFHHVYGGPHAEVNAVDAVADKSLLSVSTLYVNLEPCSHSGKTPPCADMIIRTGIPEVVIGTSDPNPLVSGNGIRKLEQSGVKVTTGVLQDQCRDLNKRFFTYHTKKRPMVILKWAQTSDGFMDVLRENAGVPEPNWISNEISRILVHKWRSEEQSILVGTRTALLDNPRLNVRQWSGNSPVRMVLDRNLRLPATLNLFDNSMPTLVFNALKDSQEGLTQYVRLDFTGSVLGELLRYLYDKGLQSVFVEGGQKLLNSFLDENLWDEARVFTGPGMFGAGISAPVIRHITPAKHRIREDVVFFYHNQ